MSTLIREDGNKWVQVAGGTRLWTGTKAQLAAALAAGELPDHTQIMVTDDYSHDITQGALDVLYHNNPPDDEALARNLLDVLGVRTVSSDEPATQEEAKECFSRLSARAKAGDFTGLRVGDYVDFSEITVDGTRYTWSAAHRNLRVVICGFDTYLRSGDTETTARHVLMQFRNCALTRQMNPTNTNAGGYWASELRPFMEKFAAGIEAAAGITLLSVRRLLGSKTQVSGSYWAWQSEKAFLPVESEVWGSVVWAGSGADYANTYEWTAPQWPIFAGSTRYRVKSYEGSRMWWWNASPCCANSASFCHSTGHGGSGYTNASYAGGVAPAFCVA